MAKILLVSPLRNYSIGNEQYPSGSLLMLGTILKRQGHNIRLMHMVADRMTTERFLDELRVFDPDIVGFTVTTYQTKTTKILLKIVKNYNNRIVTIVGGAHPSALGTECLDVFLGADVVVYGEGEKAMADIARGTPLAIIHGICYRDENGKTITNPPAPFLSDLDSLPLPDTSLINFKRYSGLFPVGRRPCMFIQSSRGCPYQCRFCSRSVFGNTLRHRSPENIIEEVGLLYRNWGIREIHFADDTFNANLNWARELLDTITKYGYHKKLVFRVALRVNEKILDTELLRHLKSAGVWFIYYGVESGNQGMLDRMHKNITVKEVKRAFKLTHETGIKTEAFFIIGLPGETRETIQDSYNLYKEIKPWWGGFSKAMPFPGTAFTEEVKSNGHLLCADYDKLNPSRFVVRTDALSAEELDMYTDALNMMTRRSKVLKPKQMMYLAIDQVRSVVANKQWTKPGGSI